MPSNSAAKRPVHAALCLGLSIPWLMSLSACGDVRSNQHGGPGAGTASTGAVTGGAGHGGQAGLGGNASEPPVAESAGPFDLHRLTRQEYANTVADLFPGAPGLSEGAATFPPDEPSPTGYRAPNAYSALQVELLLQASETIAESALQAGLLPADCDGSSNAAASAECARDFIQTFGHRAFRRPVTAEETEDLLALFQAAVDLEFTFSEALAQLVSGMLQTGSFLYHWERGDEPLVRDGELVALTPHQVASRLSYLLWETMPDAPLMDAADSGALVDSEQVAAQARRLLEDSARSQHGLGTFHEQWLSVVGVADLTKDSRRYPDFTPAVARSLEQELRTFVTTEFADRGTLGTLLTAPYAYVNQATASLYDVTATSERFERVELDPERRAGLLTGAPFLASNAALGDTDPIRRGGVVFRRVLCGDLPPSHPVVVPLSFPDPSRNPTMREILATFNTLPGCASCHQTLDTLGLAFEHYDAVGAYREADDGRVIDASGLVRTPGGAELSFANALELAKLLAQSDEVKQCATRQWFRHALGRSDSAADEGSIQRAYAAGAADPDFSLRDMLTTLVQTKTFRFRALADYER